MNKLSLEDRYAIDRDNKNKRKEFISTILCYFAVSLFFSAIFICMIKAFVDALDKS